jgi:hypothetical protein
MIFVKAFHFIVAHAPRHRRDMVDAGVGHHGVHRGVRIVCHELRAKMLFPDRYQIIDWALVFSSKFTRRAVWQVCRFPVAQGTT